jgi:hypothetical protein
MRETWPEVIYRWFGGAILSFFAFVPAWIAFHIVIELFEQPSRFGWENAIALAVSCGLLYFLGLLAFRAFTGRGRKQDGDLLPPWAMIAAIHTFGVIAAVIVVLGIIQSKLVPIVGGTAYLMAAYGALAARRTRRMRRE